MEGEIIEATQETGTALEVIQGGQTMQQVRTGFTTAVSVQKPRNRMAIIRACEEEAAIAGDEFYYAWTVKTKDSGPKLIEGPGVGLAQAAARNWGNCGVMVDIEEKPEAYIFTATFVDLETGFNLQRAFRQAKKKNIGKKYDEDRAEDIIFQIGQSKATRNVICNALPNWLIKRMMDESKKNVIAKIQKKGIDAARKDVLAFFQKHGIEQERVEAKIQKKAVAWNIDDVGLLYGAMRSLVEGVESPDELFPPLKATVVETTYDAPPELLAEINDLAMRAGVSDADKTMRIGACKGNKEAIQAYIDELKNKVGK